MTTPKIQCPYRSQCSGCSRINLAYPAQVRAKQAEVKDIFANLARSRRDPLPEPRHLIKSSSPWGYRTSTKLCLGEDRFGHRVIGLYQKQSKKIIDIPLCPVHHPALNQVIQHLFGPTRALAPAPFYQHESRSFQAGKLKYLTLRLSPDGKALSILLSHTGIPRQTLENWADSLDLTSTSLYEGSLRADDRSLVIPHKTRHLGGQRTMAFALPSTSSEGPSHELASVGAFQLAPSVFFQANGPMTPIFVESVVQALSRSKVDRSSVLLDLYGGFGAFSFAARQIFNEIWLVEANKAAIESARERLKDQAKTEVVPCHSTVEAFLRGEGKAFSAKPSRQNPLSKITHCLVNPPRSGLGAEVATLITKSLPQLQHLVYVSCNLQTLAKDLRVILKNSRLKVDSIQPLDMFPQTEHLETVVSLSMDE